MESPHHPVNVGISRGDHISRSGWPSNQSRKSVAGSGTGNDSPRSACSRSSRISNGLSERVAVCAHFKIACVLSLTSCGCFSFDERFITGPSFSTLRSSIIFMRLSKRIVRPEFFSRWPVMMSSKETESHFSGKPLMARIHSSGSALGNHTSNPRRHPAPNPSRRPDCRVRQRSHHCG